jgi:hypothetical protein
MRPGRRMSRARIVSRTRPRVHRIRCIAAVLSHVARNVGELPAVDFEIVTIVEE